MLVTIIDVKTNLWIIPRMWFLKACSSLLPKSIGKLWMSNFYMSCNITCHVNSKDNRPVLRWQQQVNMVSRTLLLHDILCCWYNLQCRTYIFKASQSECTCIATRHASLAFISIVTSMWKCSEAVYVQKVANCLESRILFFSSLGASYA